jgi:hypothetical protein
VSGRSGLKLQCESNRELHGVRLGNVGQSHAGLDPLLLDQDEGPVEVNCTQLLQFAARFWGSAATDSCDQSQ